MKTDKRVNLPLVGTITHYKFKYQDIGSTWSNGNYTVGSGSGGSLVSLSDSFQLANSVGTGLLTSSNITTNAGVASTAGLAANKEYKYKVITTYSESGFTSVDSRFSYQRFNYVIADSSFNILRGAGSGSGIGTGGNVSKYLIHGSEFLMKTSNLIEEVSSSKIGYCTTDSEDPTIANETIKINSNVVPTMSIKSGTKSPAIILLSSFLIVVALTFVGPEESKSISNSASSSTIRPTLDSMPDLYNIFWSDKILSQ